MTRAAHDLGARVAAHSTIDNVADLIEAGVDSIEHGSHIDEAALRLMVDRGVAWTPTLSPLVAFLRGELPPERRSRVEEVEARLREVLPVAQRLGVTVLAGTDASGSIPDEVALLAVFGLEPREALAAASTSAHRFLGHQPLHAGHLADLVTYEHDPRLDPDVLRRPAAVVSRGRRIV